MMADVRRIAVVTGTRAEFGLLAPVMRAIEAHPRLTLQTIATGMHLASGTWRDIAEAGFVIDAKVPMQRRGEVGRSADVQALGRGVAALGRCFEELRPDVVLVLGDRIEAFAAATAASVGGVRVAHLHGGDRAEGVADEAMRHAISKLAHVHFSATAQSRRRLIRMGERAEQVFRVGSPAVDGLSAIEPAEDAPPLIVMQHPIGDEPGREHRWMRATLAATGGHCRRGYFRGRLVLAPNHDPGREGIVAALSEAEIEPVAHLPRPRFLALLKGARVIVGNSSAGLIEAAAMKVPCVNIGPRQGGREKPANVIDCDYGQQHVRAALKEALALDLRRMRHPYGRGNTGPRVAELLSVLEFEAIPLRKRNEY